MIAKAILALIVGTAAVLVLAVNLAGWIAAAGKLIGETAP